MVHSVSDLLSYLDCSGPEYDYMRHFCKREFLAQGHNDGAGSEGTSGMDDASATNNYLQTMLAGRAPTAIPSDKPGGA